jgi:hypothetical protein
MIDVFKLIACVLASPPPLAAERAAAMFTLIQTCKVKLCWILRPGSLTRCTGSTIIRR